MPNNRMMNNRVSNNRFPTEALLVAAVVMMLLVFLALRSLVNQNATDGEERVSAEIQNNSIISTQNASGNQPNNSHTVQTGETLTTIAQRYNVTVENLITANGITDPDFVKEGTQLIIPSTSVQAFVPVSRLLPDSELVYGPSGRNFSIADAIPDDSYLRRYRDTVEGVSLNGIEVVQLVADRTRVHPRLLLAVLEYRSGWVTESNPPDDGRPLSQTTTGLTGLYKQLEWAANQLNWGYYGRSDGGLIGTLISDSTFVEFDPEINYGTSGVYQWAGAHASATFSSWQFDVSEAGLIATYRQLFGDAWQYEGDYWSGDLRQPDFALPWAEGEGWHFTGGPHGGWIAGSGWAALDFVPPGDDFGCYQSQAWVTAVADGVISRSDFGAVVLDLDGDGFTGTGWSVLYQHIATQDRIAVGTEVKRGDRLGHPSCEGGFSTGTHLHIARMYNGRWISADQDPPFNLGGWISQGSGSEYNGLLVRDGVSKAADVGRNDDNRISAEP